MSELKLPYKKPFLVQHKGDHMYPTLEDSEWLMGDSEYPIKNNAIVIVQIGDSKKTCGRLSIDGGQQFLTFDNPMYQPISITNCEKTESTVGSIRIFGTVVKVLKEL